MDGVYVYAGSALEGELRLTAVTRAGDKPVVKYSFPGGKDASALTGLAIHNGLLVCSLPKQNELLLVDAKAGKLLGAVPLERSTRPGLRRPRTAAGAGRQATASLPVAGRGAGCQPATNNADRQVGNLPHEVLVAAGLEDPQHVALDAAGNLYVSDRGDSHQVKVFDPAGKPLRVIGTAGAPKAGPYDPLHINNPNGLTIDDNGHLWVAETDFQPKRVSVWTLDGRLVRAFYGPAEYGGGGKLDPVDKTRFYYHGMEFALDWQRGTDKLVRVFFRPGPGDLGLPTGFGGGGQPEMPIYRTTASGSLRYFTNCYNSNPTNGASVVMLWLDKQGIAVPVAALGRAEDWNLLKTEAFKSRLPAGVELRNGRWSTDLLFVWSDRNGDGQVQPEEMTFLKASSGGCHGDARPVDRGFARRRAGGALRAATLHGGGAPVYDLAVAETLVEGAQAPTSSGGDQALVDPSGWTILTVAPKPFTPQSLGGVYRGQPRWSYPDLWPGLHASHESPSPDRPGELIGTTRLLGGFVTPRAGEAGPLWAVNGNQGNIYVFTADGLFVAELFRDVRRGRSWAMPIAQRGMKLNDVSLHDENFWPSITQTADGEIYLVDGARTSLVRVEGLERIRRLSETVAPRRPAGPRQGPRVPGARRVAAAARAGPAHAPRAAAQGRPDGRRQAGRLGRRRLGHDRQERGGRLLRQSQQALRRHRRGGRGRRPALRGLPHGRSQPLAEQRRNAPGAVQERRRAGPHARHGPAGRRRPTEPRAGRPAAVGDAGPRETPRAALSAGRAGHERAGALLFAVADDHHRSRGRRERQAAVRGRRGQLRTVDPPGRLGAEAPARPGAARRPGRPPRQRVPDVAARLLEQQGHRHHQRRAQRGPAGAGALGTLGFSGRGLGGHGIRYGWCRIAGNRARN